MPWIKATGEGEARVKGDHLRMTRTKGADERDRRGVIGSAAASEGKTLWTRGSVMPGMGLARLGGGTLDGGTLAAWTVIDRAGRSARPLREGLSPGVAPMDNYPHDAKLDEAAEDGLPVAGRHKMSPSREARPSQNSRQPADSGTLITG